MPLLNSWALTPKMTQEGSIALQDIEQPQPALVVIFLQQPHADLLGDAARGVVLWMNLGHEPLHPHLREGVVTTRYGSLCRIALAPMRAQHMPANVGFHRAINLMTDQATVADGLIAVLEGDGPESEAILSVTAHLRCYPRFGLRLCPHGPEAHQERIRKDTVQAVDIRRAHLSQDELSRFQLLHANPPG